mgnify:CR=1 FL=1
MQSSPLGLLLFFVKALETHRFLCGVCVVLDLSQIMEVIGVVSGFVVATAISLERDPKRILKISLASSLLSILVLLASGAMSGVVIAVAVSSATFLQIVLGDRVTTKIRILVATPFIVISFFLKEPGIIAYLPVSVFVLVRVLEAVVKELPLKVGYIYGALAWAVYYYVSGLEWMILNSAYAVLTGVLSIYVILKGYDPRRHIMQRVRQRCRSKIIPKP